MAGGDGPGCIGGGGGGGGGPRWTGMLFCSVVCMMGLCGCVLVARGGATLATDVMEAAGGVVLVDDPP